MTNHPHVIDSTDALVRALCALDRGGRAGYAEGHALLSDLGEAEVAAVAISALRQTIAALAEVTETSTEHVLDLWMCANLDEESDDE